MAENPRNDSARTRPREVPVAPTDDDETHHDVPEPFIRGANLPWVNAGWDFGVKPQDLRTRPDIDANFRGPLQTLKDAGITVVRVFVIGQGLSYVSSISSPSAMDAYCTLGPVDELAGPDVQYFTLKNEAVLPPLPEGYVVDFVALCKLATSMNLRLMPTFLSFEFFAPYGRGSALGRRGRSALVFGNDALPRTFMDPGLLPFESWPRFRARPSTPEAKQRMVGRFLDVAFEPLLRAVAADANAKAAIFAWDVCNEPDWVILEHSHLADWFMQQQGILRTIPKADMNVFLSAAVRRVAQHGMNATIGYAELAPSWVSRVFANSLKSIVDSKSVRFFHQGHYYPRTSAAVPRLGNVSSLPAGLKQFPCIVGEFPTRWPTEADDEWVCPEWMDGVSELPKEGDAHRFLYHRILRIEALGYQGAFSWSLRANDTQSAPTGGPASRQRMLEQLRWSAGLP